MTEWKADCWQEEKAYDMAKEEMEKLGHPGPYGNPWDLDEVVEQSWDESFENEENETGVCASDCYSVTYRVEVQSTDGYIGRFRVWITWALDEYGDLIDGSDGFSTIEMEKIEEVKDDD